MYDGRGWGGVEQGGAGREEERAGEGEILRQTHHLAGDGRENLCLPKPDYLTLTKRETKLFLLSVVSLADPETFLAAVNHTSTLPGSATICWSSPLGLKFLLLWL